MKYKYNISDIEKKVERRFSIKATIVKAIIVILAILQLVYMATPIAICVYMFCNQNVFFGSILVTIIATIAFVNVAIGNKMREKINVNAETFLDFFINAFMKLLQQHPLMVLVYPFELVMITEYNKFKKLNEQQLEYRNFMDRIYDDFICINFYNKCIEISSKEVDFKEEIDSIGEEYTILLIYNMIMIHYNNSVDVKKVDKETKKLFKNPKRIFRYITNKILYDGKPLNICI